jgi:hypothetical protein
VGRAGEHGHIHSDLGHQDLGDATTDAGDTIQAVHGVLERAQAFFHFDVQLLDEFIQAVQMRQLPGEQEALVCAVVLTRFDGRFS